MSKFKPNNVLAIIAIVGIVALAVIWVVTTKVEPSATEKEQSGKTPLSLKEKERILIQVLTRYPRSLGGEEVNTLKPLVYALISLRNDYVQAYHLPTEWFKGGWQHATLIFDVHNNIRFAITARMYGGITIGGLSIKNDYRTKRELKKEKALIEKEVFADKGKNHGRVDKLTLPDETYYVLNDLLRDGANDNTIKTRIQWGNLEID